MSLITSTYEIYAKQFPDKLAICTKEQKISYREWYEAVNQTANWLHTLHSTNKIVGIYMENGIPFLQVFAGAAAAGWIAVPFDLKWKNNELLKRGALASPSIWITSKQFYKKLKSIYENVMLWDDCLISIRQYLHTKLLRENNSSAPFYMGFTSGSTGNPKAFIRSHQSWIESFKCNLIDFHIQENDRILIPGSLIYSHFLYGAVSTLFLGGTVYLLAKFSATETISFLHEHPISVIYTVPTMIEALLKKGAVISTPIKIISSGAKWEEHSKQKVKNFFPQHSLYEFYGASELSFITFLTDEQKPGSVGKPCHNVEIQIRRNNQETAGPYEIGKIYVHSKMAFIGYIEGEHSTTTQSLKDEYGWVTVHDMGYLDEDGYLYLVGRENNMILYGAINIFPEEVEMVLSLHPDVERAAVIGLADPYWGQIVAAVIQGETSKNKLINWCNLRLASYKVPRKWFFIEKMPLTTGGKIARSELRERLHAMVKL
ncbi:AMP-binding protein [Heyndrickxia ginsengihumi]|uniref:AMP-binding protein n=1 Tax=Heyndrickxia ginsengihumi TaxID=363870 RepID=UPI00203CBB5A|nr:AMP-binding protein [Heyndrickxia ginsengihumi]MCM3023086.1 AMP-binding protein [Heyndrickxia ginsengihumi]